MRNSFVVALRIAGFVLAFHLSTLPALRKQLGSVASPSSAPKLSGTPVPSDFKGSLTISVDASVELLLTDSSGRRTGLDPLAKRSYGEIPNATYGDDSIDDATDNSDDPARIVSRNVELNPPAAGTYTLVVVGTATGEYDLDFLALDSGFNEAATNLKGIPFTPGSKHVYSFTHPPPAAKVFPIWGGFSGRGGNSKDANYLLTYAHPTSDSVDLPQGTKTFPLFLFYDRRAFATSFSARLDDVDVSNLFHPNPGGFEIVNIPLHPGRNVLDLNVNGSDSGLAKSDSDRFIFSVP